MTDKEGINAQVPESLASPAINSQVVCVVKQSVAINNPLRP